MFRTPDPMGDMYPGQNRYTYVLNDPLTLRDPSGLIVEETEDGYKVSGDDIYAYFGYLKLIGQGKGSIGNLMQGLADAAGKNEGKGGPLPNILSDVTISEPGIGTYNAPVGPMTAFDVLALWHEGRTGKDIRMSFQIHKSTPLYRSMNAAPFRASIAYSQVSRVGGGAIGVYSTYRDIINPNVSATRAVFRATGTGATIYVSSAIAGIPGFVGAILVTSGFTYTEVLIDATPNVMFRTPLRVLQRNPY